LARQGRHIQRKIRQNFGTISAIVLFLWFLSGNEKAYTAVPDRSACAIAAGAVSTDDHLPPGLLAAIGRVESGRNLPDPADPALRHRDAWPYTVDADGVGHWFATAAEAIAFTRTALADGARAVDVGCFQIDLQDHPNAFPSLTTAFDPLVNATYAAGFLNRLHNRLGTWPAAIAAYHSATPALGLPYADLVTAAWTGMAAPDPPSPPIADPHVIRLGPATTTMPRIVTP